MNKLHIIGMGPGDESMLTARAKTALDVSERIMNTRELPISGIVSELRNTEKGDTALLVSGDCGFFSAAKTFIKDFSDIYKIDVIPGVSSIQYLSAKLKIPYDDSALISMHGRGANIVAKVAYNKKVFALTGGEFGVKDICSTLWRYGLGDVFVTVGERLSFPDERILTGRASDLVDQDSDELSVMYIENSHAKNPHIRLADSDFIRGGVPMTKEEIRWLSIHKLNICPDDIVFDIGAGTGSVSVELARRAFDGFVYSIEANAEASKLVRKNAAAHGAFNMEIINGKAPDVLMGIPSPDKAFIGGSCGNMDRILEKLTSMNPVVKIVAVAITLQTVNQILEGLEKHNITNTEVICVNIAKSRKTGDYDMMIAQNPVYIVSGQACG